MKKILLLTLLLATSLMLVGCDNLHGDDDPHNVENVEFETLRVEFSSAMVIGGTLEEVYPLLCPEREHDYLPGWNAFIVWSESGLAEEGAVFKTGSETWIITNYDYLENITFTRYNPDVVTTLSIDVREESGHVFGDFTQISIATTPEGVAKVELVTQDSVDDMVDAMERAMQYYITNGEMIDEDSTNTGH